MKPLAEIMTNWHYVYNEKDDTYTSRWGIAIPGKKARETYAMGEAEMGSMLLICEPS